MEYKGDIHYIKEILNGRTNAFSHLVDRHKHNVFNLAFRICGNREIAEEVAQDSFMKAFRSLNGFRMSSSFATWIYRIVYNTSISYLRSKKKEIVSLEDLPRGVYEGMAFDPSEDEAEAKYREILVNYALKSLTEEDRALITLYYYEELGTDEISEITGSGKSNIKVRLFRARKKMSEIIEKIEKKDWYIMNNTGNKEEFDTLKNYIGSAKIENAPEGFTERIMMQIRMESSPVRSPRRSRYEVFIAAGVLLTIIVLVIIAGLISSSESPFFNSVSQFLGSIQVWLPDISAESLKGFTIPSVVLYVSAGILILAMLDMALNRVFHNKH